MIASLNILLLYFLLNSQFKFIILNYKKDVKIYFIWNPFFTKTNYVNLKTPNFKLLFFQK